MPAKEGQKVTSVTTLKRKRQKAIVSSATLLTLAALVDLMDESEM